MASKSSMNNKRLRQGYSDKLVKVPARPAYRNDRDQYEHYLALALEKASAGARIEAENYYQHAEHYFRSATADRPL
ncbi:DUF4167 domain-containing protein [Neorhizobium sp. Rsf11]|uniref:DUF4167 domain-containing protein n=1 Tax=Neorhizobium phenanthreniclasticum TaxID=3157917 RepID=A0ABV0M2G6_9HYPH|nr:DUF4167 domain-containing protein [Neorhizobium petrolearium]